MIRTNRLEAWLQFLEGDPARVEKCSRGLFHNLPAALKIALIPHTDRMLKLVETSSPHMPVHRLFPRY